MTVRVFFHEQAPGPESDPGRVVPVSRTVPRSPEVAIAALNELLRGPTAGECAAGYWSFFSDDTAGMLRSVRVTGGTGFADFRDFRRLLPNATSSYGSTGPHCRPRRRGRGVDQPPAAGLGGPWPPPRCGPPPGA
jgi:hypothetical protein